MLHALHNPDLHINCYYEDAECAKIVINRFGGAEVLTISPETADRIKAEMSQYEESHEGYDEDPTATIWFLFPNDLGKHLNTDERQRLFATIVSMWHEANPGADLYAPRKRGSMNVMNRIANKRRRNRSRFF